jgi:predicted aminopeptidase
MPRLWHSRLGYSFMKRFRPLLAVLLVLPMLGCANFSYYTQAIGGQFEVYSRTRPIDDVLADPAVADATKAKLAHVLRARDFASRELGLPDNNSYRAYADLERPYVLWNVFATPELSLKPMEWCFIVAGCTAYRGYFAQHDAHAFANKLRSSGYDVNVGGVAAYSTLGWFHDPMLNTIIERPLPEIAGLIFHELAHQRVYVSGDTSYNESFAMTVELEGMRRWLKTNATPGEFERYEARLQRGEEFAALALRYRDRLDALYESGVSVDDKRAGKAQLFAELRAEYARIKAEHWSGYTGYDSWFRQELNNAHLVSIGVYHRHVPAFRALLAQHQGDMPAFYRAAEDIGRLPAIERVAALEAFLPVANLEAPAL